MKTIYKHETEKIQDLQVSEKNDVGNDNKKMVDDTTKKETEIIDKTKEQKTVENKNDNTWIWLLVGLLITALIIYLTNLKDNEKTV